MVAPFRFARAVSLSYAALSLLALAGLLAIGSEPSAQLAAIERGLRQLGLVPSLEEAALDLELSAGAFDAALGRLDRQAAASARKERWLYCRGLVLARAGRKEQAGDAFRASLAEVGKLPPRLREARASHVLVAQVREELKEAGNR